MIRRAPRSTRTNTLFPYTTLFRSDLLGIDDGAVDEAGDAGAEFGGHAVRPVQLAVQGRLQGQIGMVLGHRAADHVDGVDVAGTFPQHAEMRVADEARVHPVLDVAVAAAHLHRGGGDADVVAAGAELEQRRQRSEETTSELQSLMRISYA